MLDNWNCLISDDDGHWYVCPVNKREAARQYFSATESYWAPGAPYKGKPPAQPDWLVEVGGDPSSIAFDHYYSGVEG